MLNNLKSRLGFFVLILMLSCSDQLDELELKKLKFDTFSLGQKHEVQKVLSSLDISDNSARSMATKLNTDYVIEVSSDSDKYYSFLIEDDDPLTLKNLVVRDSAKLVTSYIQEFQPSSAWLRSERKWKEFTGSLNIYSVKGDYIVSGKFENGKHVGYNSYKSSSGKVMDDSYISHDENGSFYRVSFKISKSSLEFVITSKVEVQCPDHGGGSGSSGGSSGGFSYNGGNGGSPGDYGGSEGIDDIPGGGINTGGSTGSGVTGFEGLEIAAKDFNIDDDPNYDKLTEAEKELVKRYPAEAYLIKLNKEIATKTTKQVMGRNSIQDCSDAFRHAFFNAINAQKIGSFKAKLFGDAHESEVPSHLNLEKDMDLFNNAVGYGVSNANPSATNDELAVLILRKLVAGQLKFLSPIDYNDPNFGYSHGITSDTQLIKSDLSCK